MPTLLKHSLPIKPPHQQAITSAHSKLRHLAEMIEEGKQDIILQLTI